MLYKYIEKSEEERRREFFPFEHIVDYFNHLRILDLLSFDDLIFQKQIQKLQEQRYWPLLIDKVIDCIIDI